MARRLDGSTGGESLAGPRLRAFFIYPPRSGAEAEGGCRKIAGVCPRGYWQCWRGKIKIVRFLRAFLRILTVSCALFRRFCRVKNGGGGVRLIFMAEGEGKSARMGKAFRLRVKRMRKGGKYGISY